jgi:ribonuclease HI
MSYYAVKQGREIGIYTNWEAASTSVLGFPRAMHKKFYTLNEAEAYVDMHNPPIRHTFNGPDCRNQYGRTSNYASSSTTRPTPISRPSTQRQLVVTYFDEEEELVRLFQEALAVSRKNKGRNRSA